MGGLGPVEELQEGGDGDVELRKVLQLFENHLQGTELSMTYSRMVIVMMQMMRITPTALDSRVSVMQSVEDGGEVETSRVLEDLMDLVVGENE